MEGPFFLAYDIVRHNYGISGAWATFILDKSDGFTQVGMVDILNNGTGFDALKQFQANFENAIASPIYLPSIIVLYQKMR